MTLKANTTHQGLIDHKTIELSRHEKIVAVVPEYCRGPGWSNAVVWVHIVDYSTAQHRCECIQPDERTPALSALFDAGAAMCQSLADTVPVVAAKEPK